jgi:hypothetical protein
MKVLDEIIIIVEAGIKCRKRIYVCILLLDAAMFMKIVFQTAATIPSFSSTTQTMSHHHAHRRQRLSTSILCNLRIVQIQRSKDFTICGKSHRPWNEQRDWRRCTLWKTAVLLNLDRKLGKLRTRERERGREITMLRLKLAEEGVRVDDGFGFDVGGHAEIDDKETEEISVAAANSGSGGSSKNMIVLEKNMERGLAFECVCERCI